MYGARVNNFQENRGKDFVLYSLPGCIREYPDDQSG